MEIAIVLLFYAFAFLDAIAQIPKYIGGAMSLGGVGFTVSNIIHTVKRVFVVSYPPIVALYLLSHDLDALFKVIFACYFGSALIVWIVLQNRTHFERMLARQIHAFGSGGSLWKAWTWPEVPSDVEFPSTADGEKTFEFGLFLSALWIYFFFGTVFFLVNVLGYAFQQYASVILQLSGLFNAMGTLILAFYLDPILARVFERDRIRASPALRSVLLAQIANFAILSPAFFYGLSLVFVGS
ncbi:hypothetical protein ACXYL9_02085 [Qipengyuania sp. CAU 1752]